MAHENDNISLSLVKLRSVKEDVQDPQLNLFLEKAEERLENILQEPDETLDSYIRKLYNQGYNREYIVNKVKYEYGQGSDADDVVDTWAGYEGVDLYAKGGILNKKFSFAELFGGTKKYLKGGLFDKAKKKEEPKAKVEKEKHQAVEIAGITDKLNEYDRLNKEVAEKTAELEMIKGELKSIGKDEFLRLYKEQKANPNTFLLRGDKGGCAMILPTDGYLKIDKSRAEEISKQFGEETVEEKTDYSFNAAMLEKYADVISDLILKSKNIAEEDKDGIVEAKTSYKIKKGMIDRLYELYKGNMGDAFQAIQPIFQIKPCK